MTINLSELKAQKLAEAKARAEQRKADIEARKWADDSYVDRELAFTQQQEAVTALNDIINDMREVFTRHEHQLSKRDGNAYAFNDASRAYSSGIIVELLSNIVLNIQYTHPTIRNELMSTYGLDELLVTQFIEALGSPQRWSTRDNVMLAEQPFDADAIEYYGNKLLDVFGVDVEDLQFKSTAYQAYFNSRVEPALVAQKTYEAALKAFENQQLMEATQPLNSDIVTP